MLSSGIPFFNFEHILSIIPLGLEQSVVTWRGREGGGGFVLLPLVSNLRYQRALSPLTDPKACPRIVTWAFHLPLEGDGHRFSGTVLTTLVWTEAQLSISQAGARWPLKWPRAALKLRREREDALKPGLSAKWMRDPIISCWPLLGPLTADQLL